MTGPRVLYMRDIRFHGVRGGELIEKRSPVAGCLASCAYEYEIFGQIWLGRRDACRGGAKWPDLVGSYSWQVNCELRLTRVWVRKSV